MKTKFDTFQLLNYAVSSSFPAPGSVDVKIIQLEECTHSEETLKMETKKKEMGKINGNTKHQALKIKEICAPLRQANRQQK